MDIGEITVAGMAAVPIVLGIVEMFKRLGVPAGYSPLVAVAVSVTLIGLMDGVTVASLMTGLVVGLSASGLWSGSKALAGK